MRGNLGDAYTETLWEVFDDRLPHTSDLCCYFHEKARAQIEMGRTRRAGLLATQGIRGQQNRSVLERIKRSGSIFFARSDTRWVLAGANVHISFVAHDNGAEREHELDGRPVNSINANLTDGIDLTRARRLPANVGVAFEGVKKGGAFDISADEARKLLVWPNPDGRSNAQVVCRWINGSDIAGAGRDSWIVDFGSDRSMADATLFEGPFEYVSAHVKPFRIRSRRESYAERWWLHMEARPGMRAAIANLPRYIGTPITSKHRVFVWLPRGSLPSNTVCVIARDDDFSIGVLQSRVHELWARGTGTQLREVESGFRYTPTTTFETFPFPHPTDEQRERVGDAARRLVELRDGWLNLPGLDPADLEKRILTNLYNQRPAWLDHAHSTLDAAVFGAYGWPDDLVDTEVLERLLALNLDRVAD